MNSFFHCLLGRRQTGSNLLTFFLCHSVWFFPSTAPSTPHATPHSLHKGIFMPSLCSPSFNSTIAFFYRRAPAQKLSPQTQKPRKLATRRNCIPCPVQTMKEMLQFPCLDIPEGSLHHNLSHNHAYFSAAFVVKIQLRDYGAMCSMFQRKTQTWLPHQPQLRAQGMKGHMILCKCHSSNQKFLTCFFLFIEICSLVLANKPSNIFSLVFCNSSF